MVRSEPGSVSWVECLSRDAAASRRFYGDLLGWKSEEVTAGYVEFDFDGEQIGGLVAMPASVPAEVPSYWLVSFAVADVGEACTRAVEIGGVVLEPARDIAHGRFAVLQDPAGAVFAVSETRTA